MIHAPGCSIINHLSAPPPPPFRQTTKLFWENCGIVEEDGVCWAMMAKKHH